MNNKFIWFAGLVSFYLTACVHPQQVDLIEREQRRVRSEAGQLQAELESIRSTLADTRANFQQMQRDVSAIKERIDETRVVVGRQIGQSSREGDQRIKELETRVGKLNESLKDQENIFKSREEEIRQLRETLQAMQLAIAESSQPRSLIPELAAGENDAIKRDYENAWRALEKKDYKVAIGRFKDFLNKHPHSLLASNAQYWVGECHYALKEFDRAIIEFDAVRRKFPQGEKVPAALLKQGFSFAELGEKLSARLTLLELVEKYPQSPEAAHAKQRLKTLES